MGTTLWSHITKNSTFTLNSLYGLKDMDVLRLRSCFHKALQRAMWFERMTCLIVLYVIFSMKHYILTARELILLTAFKIENHLPKPSV